MAADPMTRGSDGRAVRPPAVAGSFYPADPAELRAVVMGDLAAARPGGPLPRALVVPHAGLRYSGPVAARAYAQLVAGAAGIDRVVLIGPGHRVALAGLAVPSVAAFATPLGIVVVDEEARAAALQDQAVATDDAAHRLEHSLEVQLPFLQVVLPGVPVLPLVAGAVDAATVARVLDRVWVLAGTLLVVSTDLSHFHDDAAARVHDAATVRRILALDPGVDGEDACGCAGLNGLLLLARRRGLVPRLLDLRNSGDTAGDRSRVVGYGAFAFDDVR